LEIDFLVQETFEHNSESFAESLVPSNSPGILYTVADEDFYSKFICSESTNLYEDFLNKNKWRDDDHIHFFETSSFFEAKVLSRHFHNYKYFKDSYQSMSADSLNRIWKVSRLNEVLVLSLDNSAPSKYAEQIELGPLGDFSLCHHYFEKLQNSSEHFPSLAYKSGRIFFKFSSEPFAKSFFDSFRNCQFESILKLSTGSKIDSIALHSYFNELSLFLRFWNKIK